MVIFLFIILCIIIFVNMEYTDKYTEKHDREGLKYLKWSMFDCPYLGLGSGKMFMERTPVMVLEDIWREDRITYKIVSAYCSKKYADDLNMSKNDPHRVGLAVTLRVTNKRTRFRLIRALIVRGIQHISVSRDTVGFDLDDVKNFKMDSRIKKSDMEFVIF